MVNMDLGIKSAVKNWLENKWNNWVRNPITNKTIQAGKQVSKKWNEYSSKFQDYNPVNYYKKQESFYRGLFWIAVATLVVLWIISGS